MKLKDILTKLETTENPLAVALHKGEHFKALAIGFKKGMVLKEHQAHLPSKLFVLEGKIIYTENSVSTTLQKYDDIEIPVERMHSVEALEDSLCLLTQG